MLDTRATLIDEIIDLHGRIIGALFSKAKRNHVDRFQQSGKAINDKMRLYSRIGRALLDAKTSGGDPFAAIEAVVPWDVFSESINEAEKLAQPEEFDYLPLMWRRRFPSRRIVGQRENAALLPVTLELCPVVCYSLAFSERHFSNEQSREGSAQV